MRCCAGKSNGARNATQAKLTQSTRKAQLLATKRCDLRASERKNNFARRALIGSSGGSASSGSGSTKSARSVSTTYAAQVTQAQATAVQIAIAKAIEAHKCCFSCANKLSAHKAEKRKSTAQGAGQESRGKRRRQHSKRLVCICNRRVASPFESPQQPQQPQPQASSSLPPSSSSRS